jgi:hypothetical protein
MPSVQENIYDTKCRMLMIHSFPLLMIHLREETTMYRQGDILIVPNNEEIHGHELLNDDRGRVVLALGEATAMALSRWNGNPLDIDGITSLSLNGLTSLSEETAMALSRWRGNVLSLNCLTSLSAKAAQALSKWSGWSLSLYGITSLQVETAKALSSWSGEHLWLDGLKYISTIAAQSLSRWEGEVFGLTGLESLSKEASNALIKWKDGKLLFDTNPCNSGLKQLLNNSLDISRKDKNGRFHCDDGPTLVLSNGYKILGDSTA